MGGLEMRDGVFKGDSALFHDWTRPSFQVAFVALVESLHDPEAVHLPPAATGLAQTNN